MAETLYGKKYREVLYCPEESDWDGYAKFHDIKYDWGDILAVRRAKKKSGLCNPCKKKPEPKCDARLIYNHRFLKIPNFNPSLYNNTHSLSNGLSSSKKLIHRMEETYWSNWKPNKVETVTRVRRPKPQPEDCEFHSTDDPGQQLINYFTKDHFSSSTVTGDDFSIGKSKIIRPKSSKKCACPFPLILQDEKKKYKEESSTIDSSQSSHENRTYSVGSEDENDRTTVLPLTISQQPSHITISSDSENGSATKIKSIRHTDSFVITRKKQDVPKEHFQQPKCIKLYRNKPKGGSYPLTSLGKKGTNTKGSFRLGAPGSPILVTGSSFGGGNGKRGNRI